MHWLSVFKEIFFPHRWASHSDQKVAHETHPTHVQVQAVKEKTPLVKEGTLTAGTTQNHHVCIRKNTVSDCYRIICNFMVQSFLLCMIFIKFGDVNQIVIALEEGLRLKVWQ